MSRNKFEIILARSAGFCMGVRRAVKLVMQAANDPTSPTPIKTVGPLIHNRQVVELLKSKGVGVLDRLAEEPLGTAVIRAHGISPEDDRHLRESSQKVIDATCPHVQKVQRIAEKYCEQGYDCVVVGDEGHAEVESVLSRVGEQGHVVSRPEDVDSLPPMEKLVLVAQTTQNLGTFEQVAEKIRRRYPGCKVFDTICRSTHLRQTEVKELAGKVDTMVVVGGLNSANTRRLAEISAATGTATQHVETEEDLDIAQLLASRRIGLTAGASTPNWMIRMVLRRIRAEQDRKCSPVRYRLRGFLSALVHTNIFIGAGAAALTYANSHLMGVPFLWRCSAVAFFFILGQHLLNQYVRREAIYLNDPDKAEFFKLNERPLLLLGLFSAGLAVFLSFFLGWLSLAAIGAGSVAGLLYRFRFSRRLGRRTGIASLEQLPGSKELFVALAWAVTTALVPALAAGSVLSMPAAVPAVASAAALSFLLAFKRTLFAGLRDVEGDQLVGRETIAMVAGQTTARRVLSALIVCQTVLLILAGEVFGWVAAARPLLLVGPYEAGYFALERFGKFGSTDLSEAAADATFYLCGLLVLLWVGLL